MTDEKQAVVEEPKVEATPSPEAESAREVPLDELLSQFDAGTAKPAESPPEPAKAPTQEVEPLWAKEIKERWLEESLSEVSSKVFDGLDVSKRSGRAWFEEMARQDPKLGVAFFNRRNNPAAWRAVEKALSREAAKDFPVKRDSEESADRAAVAAAVRGASATKAPAEPAPKLGNMSPAEFYKYTRDNFGF